jgi:tetratricopeptide (TPR) repeat protein
VQAKISEVKGDFAAVEEHYLQALDIMEHSVHAGDLSAAVPAVYAEIARAQIETGNLKAAEQSIEVGTRLDPSEPMLWVARARLQQAQEMRQLALASVNYALAIWQDADEDYIFANKARLLAAELQNNLQ